MFFQILRSIAEFEHALMSERTRDGLAAAQYETSVLVIAAKEGVATQGTYCRKIEEQEKYPPDLHNVAAARAVLEEVQEG